MRIKHIIGYIDSEEQQVGQPLEELVNNYSYIIHNCQLSSQCAIYKVINFILTKKLQSFQILHDS